MDRMIEDVANPICAWAAGAASSPEEALAIMAVLPQNENDALLAAVLSRGFLEHHPRLAVKHGHAHLLPLYPHHILLHTLQATLETAATCGDLAAFQTLWQIAGPMTTTTLAGGRLVWLNHLSSNFLDKAIQHGNISVLTWLTEAAATAHIPISWSHQLGAWNIAAEAGHIAVVVWGIDHGYITNLGARQALLSACNDDTTVLEWWIASQPSTEDAMVALNDTRLLESVSSSGAGAIKSLDWWWVHVAHSSEQPNPRAFVRMMGNVLCRSSIEVVEWWWTRFLAHRTPEHKFGPIRTIDAIHARSSVQVVHWLWDHSHERGAHWDPDLGAFSFPPDWHDMSLQADFAHLSHSSLSMVHWVVQTCLALDQKLVVAQSFTSLCARGGHVDLLDYALRQGHPLVVEWTHDILTAAIQGGHLSVREWWERHRDGLSQQDLDCSTQLAIAAHTDAVDVVQWHANRFPTSKRDWQHVCIEALRYNARRTQHWLLEHVHLVLASPPDHEDHGKDEHEGDDEHRRFLGDCMDDLDRALPFTLDFFAAIAPDVPIPPSPPLPIYRSLTVLLWYCTRHSLAIAALMLLPPIIWSMLLLDNNSVMLEWWLQAHLDAGHRLVLEEVGELNIVYEDCEASLGWVHDVSVTRGIPVYV
ncbi:hypothetical protein BC828DRAFT_387030 [Blastocladiella britannica]|nr:hypothetical protein BC828DRAFT_387030 [Blastocladiella britannica]